MVLAILLSKEANMSLAPDLVTEADKLEELEGFLAWELETIPRLQASDLSNPEVYRLRLESYIMNLK